MTFNSALLKTLEQTLQQFHPALLQRMNSGMSKDEIDRLAAKYQVSLTDDMYDLFMWKDGMTREENMAIGPLLIFPNGAPLSLADAANSYDLLSLTKHLFETNYFPLFSGDNGNLLLIDLDADSPTFKSISLYSPGPMGSATPMTIYDNFPMMIETVIMCYQQKAFWVDQDVLQVNSDMHYSIAGNLNSNSSYWQYM